MERQHGFHIREKHSLGPIASNTSSSNSTHSGASIPAVGVEGALRAAAGGSWLPAKPLMGLGLSPAGRLEVVGTVDTGGKRLVREVVQGLRACQDPVACREGLGGTYFFKNDRGENVAIVKPCDEEPLAPNNPKGFVGRTLGEPGMKPTVRVGEAALREVAAYLLDYDSFAGVPHTVLVSIAHPVFHINAAQRPAPVSTGSCSASWTPSPTAETSLSALEAGLPPPKLASLQGFVRHTGDTSDLGTSQFSVAHVHRIGILDLRLYNTDRHAGNLLVQPVAAAGDIARTWQHLDRGMLALSPIDHGFCLPEALEPPYFEWLHWPQAMLPFSREELDYIARLDVEADCQLLRRELPWLREAALRTLTISTLVLQAGAAAGLTLHEIGSILSRSLVGVDEEPSQLERLCSAARQASQDCSDSASSVSSGGASVSDFIAESWEEGEKASQQDPESPTRRELQFEVDLDSESEGSTDRQGRVHLHGMPLPLGKQAGQDPALSTVSPASLSPLSSRSSAFTVFPRKSFSPDHSVPAGPLAAAMGKSVAHAERAQRTDPHHIITPRPQPTEAGMEMAKSVAAGGMLRPGGTHARKWHRRHEAAGHKHRHHHPHRPAPAEQPAMEGGSNVADPLAGLGDEEWPVFLTSLRQRVSQDLAAGKLGPHQADVGGGRGMAGTSCPAF